MPWPGQMAGKIFSFDEARALIPRVRELTAQAEERVRALTGQAARHPQGSAKGAKLREWLRTAVERWSEKIQALGALPKGKWTVDFDSGQGYFYCWTAGEDDLTHFYLYEDGFAGRMPLAENQKSGLPPRMLN